MDEIRSPDVVRCIRFGVTLTQLRLDASLGRFFAQLQTYLTIKPASGSVAR